MSLPKYIINFNELTDDLKKNLLEIIDNELRDKYPQLNTDNIELLLENIKEILPSTRYEGLKNKIEDFILYRNEGIQKIEGRLLDIPPVVKNTIEIFKFDKDIFLTGLHFNQTGWKKEDKYSLEINKNKIINSSATKEIGEHKHFNTYFKVNANVPISFILHNNSGNSRQVIVDLEYLEGEIATEIIDPGTPGIDDIKNDWDIAVVMQWEKNTAADIDLHGFIEDKHVYYGCKSYDGFYLNFDFTEHVANTNPEILSVKGYKNEKLNISIQNYNNVELKEPVNIKIYNKRPYGNKLLKEINISLNDNTLKSVCTINLSTLEITTF
ncbi:hypothetical protein [Clostridium estertheticum]|uniref:hypothetical protein n=1 Tax=Clostridium estertheticum TaxID=238834 RepID=UPI001C0BD8EC|nr:hypothetical protein [Clostridium estertheticum]MBU3185667.1 hypothetical protein [Clostridium estertheticum]